MAKPVTSVAELEFRFLKWTHSAPKLKLTKPQKEKKTARKCKDVHSKSFGSKDSKS